MHFSPPDPCSLPSLIPSWPPLQRPYKACTPLGLRTNPSAVTAALRQPDPRTLNGLLINLTSARELLELHQQYGTSFNHINLATCWSRLGRVRAADRRWLQSDDGARLSALREQTNRQLTTFEPRAVSGTSHALAKLSLRGAAWASLWNEIERAAFARSSKFKPQELANTAWAFATAGHAAPALIDAIAEEAARRV